MAHILVVDDAADIRVLLRRALEKDGHRVTEAENAAQVTTALCQMADLILLDVLMPGEDGFSLCRRIRADTDCPIVFLTACDAENDVMDGLGMGGDDYLVKPFRLAELRARVQAHLRRAQRTPVHRLTACGVSFDLSAREAYCGQTRVPLTKGEYALCEFLARHAGFVYTREQLIENVFGFDSDSDAAAITEHIKNIRAKLSAAGLQPVETVWGMGYKWKKETV